MSQLCSGDSSISFDLEIRLPRIPTRAGVVLLFLVSFIFFAPQSGSSAGHGAAVSNPLACDIGESDSLYDAILPPHSDYCAETPDDAHRNYLLIGTTGTMPLMNMVDKPCVNLTDYRCSPDSRCKNELKASRLIGLDIDLAREISRKLPCDEPRFLLYEFGDLKDALDNGHVDMVISGYSMTPKRSLRHLFVGPYATFGKCLVTKDAKIARQSNLRASRKRTTKRSLCFHPI